MKIMFTVAIVAIITLGCSRIMDRYGIPQDSPVEEAIEQVIKHYTGIDIDISEATPEQ